MPADNERARLSERYREMTDIQLEEIAAEAFSLTDVALEVLRDEVVRRKLDIEVHSTVPEIEHPPDLVVIRSFRDIPEAILAKGILDSAGILCILDDANTIRMDWFLSNAIGGVKLRVKHEDAAAANELLSQKPPESFDAGEMGEFVQPRCPACGSLEVSFRDLVKLIAYSSLYLGIPAPVRRDGWRCGACGYQWDHSPQESEEKH